MDKFEYKIVGFVYASENPEHELNELGKQGWELVSVTGNPMVNAHYILKRKLQ